jgi:DNA-binding response OmpR family regulator
MSNYKILIVEDDPDVRLGYHVMLKANRFETFVAADAVSATSQARTHQPDLIILDLGLPAGDGFIVLERLRANASLSLIPVIVVSARDVQGNKERSLTAGAKAYVQKPWNDDELLSLIDRVLAESGKSAFGLAASALPANLPV